MSQHKNSDLTEEELARETVGDDPLVQRAYNRSKAESRWRAWNDHFFGDDAPSAPNSGAGLAFIFVLTTVWAIITSIFEAIPYEWNRAKENRRKKREKLLGIDNDRGPFHIE